MLENQLLNIPENSGVYQFFNHENKLLYIGKAKNLKNRVKSYFKFTPHLQPATNLSSRITIMIQECSKLEYILVKNEQDALILENSLIKQLKPKYNILLRDDKTYPYIYIDLNDEFPRFEITRKIIKGNIKYFGPYSNAAKDILEAIYLIFPLVQKKSCIKSKKACLFYQIKRCLAPCEHKITSFEYKKMISQALKIMYNPKKIVNFLEEKMNYYAQNLYFEEAANLRDKIKNIKNASISSNIDLAKIQSFDLFAILIINDIICGVSFCFRDGKLISTKHDIKRNTNSDMSDLQTLYEHFILESYPINSPLNISKILISHDIQTNLISKTLCERFNKKISIKYPKIGDKKNLCETAIMNAKNLIKNYTNDDKNEFLNDFKNYFLLSNYPNNIEIFDNSHLFKTANVGAMVSWNKNFNKKNYRHFHLNSTNEYSQMQELLTYRVQRFDKLMPPDLWVIDGGKALLNLATKILQNAKIDIDVIAISKEKVDFRAKRAKGRAKDIIYYKDLKYNFSQDDKKLQFLQKLRDEAHRFAITFHQKTKNKLDMQSSTLKKLGFSDAKIKKLLLYFGSFDNIYLAKDEEICQIITKNEANKLKNIKNV